MNKIGTNRFDCKVESVDSNYFLCSGRATRLNAFSASFAETSLSSATFLNRLNCSLGSISGDFFLGIRIKSLWCVGVSDDEIGVSF